MKEMITAQEVVFEYEILDEQGQVEGYKRALDGLNIKAISGQFVAILGHNGSGKSTFAKLLNAILFPKEGSLYIAGLDAKDEKNVWDIRKNAGMVFQNPDNQIIATVVEEDVAFGPENLGVPPLEIRKRVDDALKAVHMEAYRHHAPHMLSGGQKQRIAIAGILAMHPKCVIFDEPTAMLDPSGRKEVMETIRRLHAEGITVILITHYMDEAVLADYIYVMETGKVILEGAPRQVFANVPAMRKIGLDVPQVTELAYVLREEGINIGTDVLTVEEMVGRLCILK